MGSLGDDNDGEIKSGCEDPNVNSALSYTNPFDSQFLPSPLPGEKGEDANNELQFLQSTMPFEDTVRVEDAFETQVVDLGGETQALDDLDWFENVDTQLIDEIIDSDGEGTDRTEVLDDGDELSDDESGRRGKCESLEGEKIQDTSLSKHGEKGLIEHPDALTDEHHLSGSVLKFTSVRVKSLRVSGLAARSSASNGTNNSDSCSLVIDGQVSEQFTVNTSGSKTKIPEDVDWRHNIGRSDDEMKEFSNGSRCKIGCSAVRNLFAENSFIETKGHFVGGKEVPICDDGVAGLSYIDSQEPGDLSQADALLCVQKLIEESKVLFDEVDLGKIDRKKLSHISAAKGAQSLAKKTTDGSTEGKSRIFDWDDGLEDEGGGDIFRRRKENFFGTANLGQRSFMEPSKSKGNQPGVCMDNEGKSNVQNVIVVHPESKIDLCNRRANKKMTQETETNVSRNLFNEFDEQSEADTSTGQLEALTRKEVPEMLDIGLDTQMAAEAMEALFHGEGIAYDATNDSQQIPAVNFKDLVEGSMRSKAKKSICSKQHSLSNNEDIGVTTHQSKKTLKISAKLGKQSLTPSQKCPENVRKECDMDVVLTRSKRARLDAGLNEVDRCNGTASRGYRSVKKQDLPEELATLTPVAHRTRHSLAVSKLKSAENVSIDNREKSNRLVELGCREWNKAGVVDVEASKVLNAKGNSSGLGSSQPGEPKTSKSRLLATDNDISFPRRKRSRQNFSGQLDEPHNLHARSKPSCQPGNIEKSVSWCRRSQTNARISTDLNMKRKTRSSMSVCPNLSPHHFHKQGIDGTNCNYNSVDMNGKMSNNLMGVGASVKSSHRRSNADSSPSAANEVNVPSSDNLPSEKTKSYESACASPGICMTPVNAASPVCMGSEYKQSRRKNLSRACLVKEMNSLCAAWPGPISEPKDTRKRRDLSDVRVLFSHHLDEDIIKQQRKIADRLKVSIASSITDATHFITDQFVRTRNMLEAIASGKPVVTHLWLENVGQANYYIDEQKYIVRDSKKEKEFGFNLAVSLAHARQHPLLHGRRVLITPKTKPGKEIISSLVKAVHGQAVERVGRSTLQDDVVSDHLLVLSCEEDYDVCVPFLEKGAAVYSSELLLNGIVTQKLEYERYRLFADHVKRTRSTVWMKKDGHNFIPVTKRR
ncbi:pax transcription activation domain interacting protein [Salix suchowensis]|nr:pax transcription activation domain interacting protein [Salix suchowensis]